MFHEPLRGDGYLAPALHFLIGFDDVKWRDGAGLGTAFDLAEAILRDADGAALHFKELHRRHPVPELRGRGEKQILPGLGNPDVRARVCEFRSLQFGIFRVRHQPSQEREEPAEEDLLIAVIEGEIRNLGIADRLSDAGHVPKAPGMPGFYQRVIEAAGLGTFSRVAARDKPLEFGVIHDGRLERPQRFEHLPAGHHLFGSSPLQERVRAVDPRMNFIDAQRDRGSSRLLEGSAAIVRPAKRPRHNTRPATSRNRWGMGHTPFMQATRERLRWR